MACGHLLELSDSVLLCDCSRRYNWPSVVPMPADGEKDRVARMEYDRTVQISIWQRLRQVDCCACADLYVAECSMVTMEIAGVTAVTCLMVSLARCI